MCREPICVRILLRAVQIDGFQLNRNEPVWILCNVHHLIGCIDRADDDENSAPVQGKHDYAVGIIQRYLWSTKSQGRSKHQRMAVCDK